MAGAEEVKSGGVSSEADIPDDKNDIIQVDKLSGSSIAAESIQAAQEPLMAEITVSSGKTLDLEGAGEAVPFSMTEISAKENEITDADDWYLENGLFIPILKGNCGDIVSVNLNAGPDMPDPEKWTGQEEDTVLFDEHYIYAIDSSTAEFHKKHVLSIYERQTGAGLYTIYVSDSANDGSGAEDYSVTEINWACLKNGILYFSLYHNGYAMADTCYIAAVDLSSLKVLWTSEPQTCNANNFIVTEDKILCGYGFTAEEDYLYQLDLATGKVIAKTLLKTAPDLLAVDQNLLYVRCYDTDYVFDIAENTGISMKQKSNIATGMSYFLTDFWDESDDYSYNKDVNEKEFSIPGSDQKYRFIVTDAALGTRAYALERSENGVSWDMYNDMPFGDQGGSGIDVWFTDEKTGFAELVNKGDISADLYVTYDGALTFAPVEIESITYTFDDGTTGILYDYPLYVYREESNIYMLCGQGADGDYNGGDGAAVGLFLFDADGKRFTFVDDITKDERMDLEDY